MSRRRIKDKKSNDDEAANIERISTLSTFELEAQLAVVDTIYSLALKIQRTSPDYPEWVYEIVVPPNTLPSIRSADESFTELKRLYKGKFKHLPPVHNMEKELESKHAILSRTCVTFVDPVSGDKEVWPIVNGLLVRSSEEVIPVFAGVTATLIAGTTRVTDDNSIDYIDQKSVVTGNPVVTTAQSRSLILKNFTKTPTAARNEMYSLLIRNPMVLFRVHSACGTGLKNYTKDEDLSKFYADEILREDKLRAKRTGLALDPRKAEPINSVNVGDMPFIHTNKVTDAWKFHSVSSSIRAEKKSLSSGCERFENTPSLSDNINFCHDVLNFCDEAKIHNVLTYPGAITKERMRVLVFNGINVFLPSSGYPPYVKGGDIGIYGSNFESEEYVRYLGFDVSSMGATVSKLTVSFKNISHAINALVEKNAHPTFTHLMLAPSLKRSELTLLPSASADKMYVVVASHVPNMKSYSLNDLATRSSLANCIKNRFIFERRVLNSVEFMEDYMRWDRDIKYPMMRTLAEVKKNYMHKYDANLTPGEKIVVTEGEFKNIQAQMKAKLLPWKQAMFEHYRDNDFVDIFANFYGGDVDGIMETLLPSHYVNMFDKVTLNQFSDCLNDIDSETKAVFDLKLTEVINAVSSRTKELKARKVPVKQAVEDSESESDDSESANDDDDDDLEKFANRLRSAKQFGKKN